MTLPTQRFDLSQDLQTAARSARRAGTVGGLAGTLVLALGLYVVLFRPGNPLGGTETDLLEAALGLVALGGGFVVLAVGARLRPERLVRSAVVDDAGLQLTMNRPPDWSIRWDQPGLRMSLLRGIRSGEPAGSHGWVLSASKFQSTVNGPLGQAIRDAAQLKGLRVGVDRTPTRNGAFEVVMIDDPANPAR